MSADLTNVYCWHVDDRVAFVGLFGEAVGWEKFQEDRDPDGGTFVFHWHGGLIPDSWLVSREGPLWWARKSRPELFGENDRIVGHIK